VRIASSAARRVASPASWAEGGAVWPGAAVRAPAPDGSSERHALSRSMERWALIQRKRARNTNSLVGTHISLLIGARPFPTRKASASGLVIARSRAQMIAALRRFTPILRYSDAT
jgi:hypothetical protein